MSVQYATLQLAATGRARYGACKAVIAAGQVRLRLGWESGFRYLHAACGARHEAHHVQAALRTWTAPAGFDAAALADAAADGFRAAAAAGHARLMAELATEQQAAGGPSPRVEPVAASAGTRCAQCRRPLTERAHVVDGAERVHLGCMDAWAARQGSPERWERALAENSSAEDVAAARRAARRRR